MKKNILIIILTVIILGLCGYLVYDKVIDKDDNVEIKDETKVEEKDFDLVEAKKIVDKYMIDYRFFENYLIKNEMVLTDEDKIYITIQNTESTDIDYTCKEAFPNGYEAGVYYIDTDYIGVCYEDYEHFNYKQYTYESLNETYKKLFGYSNNLPKKYINLVNDVFKAYAYSEKYDAYIQVSCECGGQPDDQEYIYDIETANLSNDFLHIVVKYTKLTYDETIKFKFTFKKSDTGYYLESINKVIY